MRALLSIRFYSPTTKANATIDLSAMIDPFGKTTFAKIDVNIESDGKAHHHKTESVPESHLVMLDAIFRLVRVYLIEAATTLPVTLEGKETDHA